MVRTIFQVDESQESKIPFLSPAAKTIWYYLLCRKLRDKSLASKKDLIVDLNFDQKTVTEALRILRSNGMIAVMVLLDGNLMVPVASAQ